MNDPRQEWTQVATRLATPVLTALATRELRRRMPIEAFPGHDPGKSTHLEAFGRLLAGLAPWLEAADDEPARALAPLARAALDAATDPDSPDCLHRDPCGQHLVDTAFLAQGLLRAPGVLWEGLEARVKANVIRALRSTRAVRPAASNWLLFSAMVEAALFVLGAADWDRMRLDYAIRQHEQWYLGDGVYGDGAHYRADYYNAFVIQPMLVDIIRHVGGQEDWGQFAGRIWRRARRYAAIQERSISPEGTFPPVGRSLAYRFGALQTLAHMALLRQLPDEVPPAQARAAMSAVIRRTMARPETFDENGWLRIGFCGAQPGVGEIYISTGSLYLCAVGLLPLGLPAADPFWTDPPLPWTAVRAWGGEAFPIDHALPE